MFSRVHYMVAVPENQHIHKKIKNELQKIKKWFSKVMKTDKTVCDHFCSKYFQLNKV